MPEPTPTHAPADAADRRAVKPLVCYEVESLPPNNLDLYQRAREGAELIETVVVPPRWTGF